jgi:glycosyltransferase involved in cell wall biosynthesis
MSLGAQTTPVLTSSPEIAQRDLPRVVKLIYQSYLPFQGRYPRVSGQARILRESDFDVTILACDREGQHAPDEVLEGIPVHRIRARTGEFRGPFRQIWPLLVFWVKAYRWLVKQQFDILHCHNIDVLLLGYLVGRRTRRPVVFEAHEPEYYALWPKRWKPLLRIVNGLERFLARRTSAISVTNQWQVEKYRAMQVPCVELMGNYPLPNLRIEAIPAEKFERTPTVFGRLGTIYRDTGFETAIMAFRRVLNDHPETRFLIAGRVADNYREDFDKLIEPVRDRVQLTGAFSASEMPNLYHQIDASVFIYPRSDWFRNITPRKFFDSLANGVPVIMTDIGRLGPVIREHECGFVVEENDPDAIAAAMKRIIEDVPLRRRMAENSLQLAKTEFDWNRMAGRYVALQHSLLAESRGR